MNEPIEITNIDYNILQQRPDVNPYRYAAYEVWKRLKWDLNPESWRSRSKLKQLRDKYSGEKAVIVCNGPSLLNTNLDGLDNIFTFGLNKINLLFEKSHFRPSCIVATNHLVIEQNTDFYNSTSIPLFLSSYALNHVQSNRDRVFLHCVMQKKFARDCSFSIAEGGTVTFIAMQLAFHLGFKQVALIGCDHNFAVKGFSGMVVESGQEDASHFDPRYFAGGAKWMLPDLTLSEVSYELAKKVYLASDREIFNATIGGKLEVFPRITLEEFLGNE
jgi:hypothetical protein